MRTFLFLCLAKKEPHTAPLLESEALFLSLLSPKVAKHITLTWKWGPFHFCLSAKKKKRSHTAPLLESGKWGHFFFCLSAKIGPHTAHLLEILACLSAPQSNINSPMPDYNHSLNTIKRPSYHEPPPIPQQSQHSHTMLIITACISVPSHTIICHAPSRHRKCNNDHKFTNTLPMTVIMWWHKM